MSEAKPEETTIDDKPEEKVEDEEQGGLDEDDDILTLKSGGQNPKSFEIPKTSASLSKFVTTILEGTICFALHSRIIRNALTTNTHTTTFCGFMVWNLLIWMQCVAKMRAISRNI